MPKVKMYTTATCVYCAAEKQFFQENNIAYEEVLVDTNEKIEELARLSGQLGVPFTVITPEKGEPVSILGFDQPRLKSALGLA
jgi:glutaredoxin 3